MNDPDHSRPAIPPPSQPAPDHQPNLLDQVRPTLRSLHYSIRTEDAYVQWIERFIHIHGKRHPREMGELEVDAFLTNPTVEGNIAASTQNRAMSERRCFSPRRFW